VLLGGQVECLKPSRSDPLVSIIIPSKNSASTLAFCLKSLRAQTYQNFELIIVDNYSQDQTRNIAAKFGARVFLKGPERCSQVNFGVSQAKGKYVYRVDSDFVVEPTVVEEAVGQCETNGYDAILVHNTSDESVSFWSRVRKMERDCYIGDEINVAARFWKKSAFESVGGFDVDLVAGDDYDIQNRLVRHGFKIGRIKAQEKHLGEPKSMSEIFWKHYYYGQNIGRFIEKNRDKAFEQLSPLRRSLRQVFSKSSGEPALILGFVVYQFLRYTGASLGMLFAKLKF
jgi:glycosyltransferase involved in cell wall biosynthesis